MSRGIGARKTGGDGGFTLVEVLVAASILFFVLTAILGLVLATTQMTALAKERASITNLVASRLDWVRSQPYAWIAQSNLASETTTTADGFTVALTYTVTDKSTVNGTKEVRVVAAATKIGHPPIHMSAFAAIRNAQGGVTLAGLEGEAPQVVFEDPTPAQDSVLFGNNVYGGGNVLFRIMASASTGCDVRRIEMLVDGIPGPVFLRDGNTPFSAEAFRDFTVGNVSESMDFSWNTAQVDTAGTPTVADGYRFVRVTAFDSSNRQGSRSRRFLVDNYPPNRPGPPQQDFDGAGWTVSDSISWGQSSDGTDAAAKYEVQLLDNATGSDSLSDWRLAGTYVPSPPAATSVSTAVSPFSCYLVRVRAGSPRATAGGSQSWSTWTEGYTASVSPPLLQGSYRITRIDLKGKYVYGFVSTFALPAIPAWVQPGSARYELWRGLGNTAPVLVADVTGSAGGMYTDTAPSQGPFSTSVNPLPYTYSLKVTVTPSGYKSPGPRAVWSNRARTGTSVTAGTNFTALWW